MHMSWLMLTILFDLQVDGILCAGIDGMSLVHLDVTLDVRCHTFQISK